jgi:hypothetical protein
VQCSCEACARMEVECCSCRLHCAAWRDIQAARRVVATVRVVKAAQAPSTVIEGCGLACLHDALHVAAEVMLFGTSRTSNCLAH